MTISGLRGGTGDRGVTLSTRRQKTARGLKPASVAILPVGSDLDQLPFTNQHLDHRQDSRWLGVHDAADLGKAQPILFVFKEVD